MCFCAWCFCAFLSTKDQGGVQKHHNKYFQLRCRATAHPWYYTTLFTPTRKREEEKKSKKTLRMAITAVLAANLIRNKNKNKWPLKNLEQKNTHRWTGAPWPRESIEVFLGPHRTE
jgi:hypothetical protein